MKNKFVKNALLCFVASSIFGVLWLVFLNLADVARINQYEGIVVAGFVVAAICMALLFTRKYLMQTERSMLRKAGYVTAVAIPSLAVMVGAFYAAIFVGLTYLH